MRKYLPGIVAIVVVIALAVGLGIKTGDIDNPFSDTPKAGPKTEATVGKDGGTFTFPDGVVITVPKGAVKEETTLSAGGITPLRPQDPGPFGDPKSKGVRAGAVKFDVSLSRDGQNGIQPAKPLELRLKLVGKLKPAGVTTQRPLLYTPNPSGKTEYILVPSRPVGKDGVMVASLGHLSPKYLTYVDDQALLDSFFPDKVTKDRGECKQEIKVGDDKIKLTGHSKGWSLKDDSPIFACLFPGSEGYVRVGVLNRIEYMLSTNYADNARVVAERGNADEEIVKLITNTVFKDQFSDVLVGTGDKLVASMKVDELPSYVRLSGDARTFGAETLWRIVNLTVSLIAGKDATETVNIASKLFNVTAVTSCFEDALKDMPHNPTSWDITVATTGCITGPVIEAIAEMIDAGAIWKRILWVGEAVGAVLDAGKSIMNGIKLQANRTMVVSVERELNLGSFAGQWSVHGSHLTINADGTGMQTWKAGPCADDLSAEMCTGHSPLTIRKVDGGVQVTRSADPWYTTDSGQRTVPDSVREYGEERKNGDATVLVPVSDTALKSTKGNGEADGFGNPYLCRLDGPEVSSGMCG